MPPQNPETAKVEGKGGTKSAKKAEAASATESAQATSAGSGEGQLGASSAQMMQEATNRFLQLVGARIVPKRPREFRAI